MASFPLALQKLIAQFCKLPSVGEKTAARLAYHLVSTNRELARNLESAIGEALRAVRLCESCFFLSDDVLCSVCRDPNRDTGLLCVVEKPVDVVAIERTGEYRGRYHVLHGLWAPLRGQGPETMRLSELRARLATGELREVILATGSTVEGDATALFVARMLNEYGIKSTRLAQGMPKGGELEYADEVTLARAFSGRAAINS